MVWKMWGKRVCYWKAAYFRTQHGDGDLSETPEAGRDFTGHGHKGHDLGLKFLGLAVSWQG